MPKAVAAQTLPALFPAVEAAESHPFAGLDAGAPVVEEVTEVAPVQRRPVGQPLWKRVLAEGGQILSGTCRQTVAPFRYLFSAGRRRSLSKKAIDDRYALGQRMVDSNIGSATVRGKIRELGDRIHSIEAVKGDARSAVAERRNLVLQLADSALASKAVPATIETEQQRARAAQAALAAQEETVKNRRSQLRPDGWAGWRRVAIGYTTAAAILALAVFLLRPNSESTSPTGTEVAVEGGRTSGGTPVATPMATPPVRPDPTTRPDQFLAIDDRDKSAEQIVDLCGPSVALIRFKGTQGGGSGFMIRPGIVATNAHVVDSVFPNQLKVSFPSLKEGSKTVYTPKGLLYFDHKRDLACLAVAEVAPALRLADRFEFKSGREITVIGSPGRGDGEQLPNVVTKGLLSTQTEIEKQTFYQMSIAVNPGNSGGPVFDARGHIIGVVTLKANREGISFCVPWKDLNTAIAKMEQLKPSERAEHTSRHAVGVAFRRVAMSAFIYGQGMQHMAAVLRTAERGRRPEKDAAAEAKRLFAARGGTYPLLDLSDVKPHMDRLRDDPNVLPAIRTRMNDLWATYTELKTNVEKPHYPAKAYQTKAQQLLEKWEKDVKFIRNTLDIDHSTFRFGDD
jgi:S1-C subfamily serine protease